MKFGFQLFLVIVFLFTCGVIHERMVLFGRHVNWKCNEDVATDIDVCPFPRYGSEVVHRGLGYGGCNGVFEERGIEHSLFSSLSRFQYSKVFVERGMKYPDFLRWNHFGFDSHCGSAMKVSSEEAVMGCIQVDFDIKSTCDGFQTGGGHHHQVCYNTVHVVSVFQQLEWTRDFVPVGEALNPGPPCGVDDGCRFVKGCPLMLSTFNPTQLLGREHDISQWNDGVWCASETSHTADALVVIQSRLRQHGINGCYSTPVERQCGSYAGSMRGKASGTAILSRFRMSPYPEPVSTFVSRTSRFVDALVDIGQGVRMYVCSLYGPPLSNTSLYNGEEVFHTVASVAVQRALAFRGPAAILGDMNRDLDDLFFWPRCVANGWHDCALLAEERYGQDVEATCRHGTRRSFILVNSHLARQLTSCCTTHHFQFDTHPVLEAIFSLDACRQPVCRWSLPRSLDDYLFDPQLVNQNGEQAVQRRGLFFEMAEGSNDTTEMFRQFCLAFNETVKDSAVDVEGNSVRVANACMKQPTGPICKLKPASAPCVKPGRQGDVTPAIAQANASVCRHVKQLRRLQSLYRQLSAHDGDISEIARSQCEHLWQVILRANGFKSGFTVWVLDELGMFVPLSLPSTAYVAELVEGFSKFYHVEVVNLQLEKSRKRREVVAHDISQGGPMLHREVKDQSAPPLGFLAWHVSAKAKRMRWAKQGMQCIVIDGCHEFVEGFPITFQGQTVMLLRVVGNHLYLDGKVKLKDANDLCIKQRITYADLDSMHSQIASSWSQMWQRDPSDDSLDNWSGFIKLADDLACQDEFQYQPFDEHLWNASLKGLSNKSSRGACGFSPRDLKLMPSCLVRWLFRIYHKFESGAPWPFRFGQARVAMLSKPDAAHDDPLAVRPITILPVLYRQWSRYRSLQVLSFLGSKLPPQIGGVANHLSSEVLVAWVMDILEEGRHETVSYAGLVVDLTKAFNLIPRKPLAILCQLFGIPIELITAHQNLLSGVTRYIDLGGCIGKPVTSTTGVPEGCSFSVVSMTIITAFMAAVIHGWDPQILVALFADNWGFIVDDVGKLQKLLDRLREITQSLKLDVSAEKSWVWASSSSFRARLHDLSFGDCPVKPALYNKDLGVDVSYCKRVIKKTTKKRWAKALKLVKRVKAKRVSRAFKSQMCLSLGVGSVCYGAPLYAYTKSEWTSLRSGYAHAIGLHRSGANSLLSLSVTWEYVDPQLRNLKRRILFFRRYFQQFPERKEKFLQKICQSSHPSKHGPAYAFHFSCKVVGWTCRDNGWLTHKNGISFNWLDSSIRHVSRCLDRCWSYFVCDQLKQRKDFDIEHFDASIFASSFRNRDVRKQGILATFACGKHVTNDKLALYSRNVHAATCSLCDQEDSKHHRIFECEALSDLRVKFRNMFQWLGKQATAVAYFGVVPFEPRAILLKQKHCTSSPKLSLPERGEHQHLFADGSAFFNCDWELAISGAAVLRVDFEKMSYRTVLRDLVPGADHSSYRGESWGLFHCLQSAFECTIYLDCEAVVNEFQRLLKLHECGLPLAIHSSPDIWSLIAWHISNRPLGVLRVVKVAAHVNWQSMQEGWSRQCAFFNAKVDEQAKKAVTHDHAGLFKRLCGIAKSKDVQAQHLHAYHDFLCCAAERCFQQTPASVPIPQEMPDFSTHLQFQSDCVVSPSIPVAVSKKCPFGEVFAERFLCWWQTLQWGAGSYTSSLELYFDFCNFTSSQVPVMIKKGVYRLRDDNLDADISDLALSKQTLIWNRALKWFLQFVSTPCFANLMPGLRCLHIVGYSILSIGFPCRINGRCKSDNMVQLWRYFHPPGAVKTRRDLKAAWTLSSKISARGG